MSEDEDKLSPGALMELIHCVREGEKWGDDAKELLAEFVRSVNNGTLANNQDGPTQELLYFLRDAFASYLIKTQSLEAALGLARRKRGNPGADKSRARHLAIAVWKLRLSEMTHEEALYQVGKQLGAGTTKVGKAWKTHKADALLEIRIARVLNEDGWTAKELGTLKRIGGKAQWFRAAVGPTLYSAICAS